MFDWNDAYANDFTPWDIGGPCPLMVQAFQQMDPTPSSVLELGCGRGHDAAWLADQGCRVTAMDAVAQAIQQARDRAPGVTFVHGDVLDGLPVDRVDLVYDTGLLHHLGVEDQARLAAAVAQVLPSGGRWLNLSGSAEQPEGGFGPPRMTATRLVGVLEPHFAIESLEAVTFSGDHEAWRLLLRKR